MSQVMRLCSLYTPFLLSYLADPSGPALLLRSDAQLHAAFRAHAVQRTASVMKLHVVHKPERHSTGERHDRFTVAVHRPPASSDDREEKEESEVLHSEVSASPVRAAVPQTRAPPSVDRAERTERREPSPLDAACEAAMSDDVDAQMGAAVVLFEHANANQGNDRQDAVMRTAGAVLPRLVHSSEPAVQTTAMADYRPVGPPSSPPRRHALAQLPRPAPRPPPSAQ